jgi:hypothetical protein
MSGSAKTTKSSENYQKILQAMLDSYRHPVWIVEDDHIRLMNEPAKELESQGFVIQNLSQNMNVGEVKILSFKGRDISIKKSMIKNGGTVFLHEVSFETPSTARLKASTAKLRKAITR